MEKKASETYLVEENFILRKKSKVVRGVFLGVVFFFPIHVVRFPSDQLILVGLSLCIFLLLFLSSLLVINIFLDLGFYIFSLFSIIISLFSMHRVK